MADQEQINPAEQDLKLVRLLDKGSKSADLSRREAGSGQDPLLPILNSYKDQARLRTDAKTQSLTWEKLEERLDNHPDHHEQPAPAESGSRWVPLLIRVAAVLAVAVLLSVYLFFRDTMDPELLAESSGEKVQMVLLDGTVVTLRPYSSLYRIVETETEQRYKIRGEAYFDVEPVMGRDFAVMTRDARVSVTGTRFTVRTWDDRTRIYLEQGSVIVSLEDGEQAVALSPGESAWSDDGRISKSDEVRGDVYLGWLNDELVLDRRPFSAITREVSHHFNITVAVSSGLEDTELSGTLVLDDAELVLNDLAVTSGAVVEQTGPGQYLILESESNR